MSFILIKTGSSDLRTICPCSSFFSVELVNRQSAITSLIAFVVFGGLSKLALNGNQMHFYVDEELLSAQKVSPQFFLPFNVSDGRDIYDVFHYHVTFKANKEMSTSEALRYLIGYYFDRYLFNTDISDIVDSTLESIH